jgi:hypothetical protein
VVGDPRRTPPPQPALDPFTILTALTSRVDWLRAICVTSAELFPSFAVLEIGEHEARCLVLRLAGGPAADGSGQPPVPLGEAAWLLELRAAGRPAPLDQLRDPQLVALVERLGIPAVRNAVLPVMTDDGELTHAILGHGLGDRELAAAAPRLALYLGAAADALRLLALRDRILQRRQAALAPPAEPERPARQTQARPAVDPRQVVESQRPVRHLDFSTGRGK